MPVYIAMQVPEIPQLNEVRNGAVIRLNAVDDTDALQQAAAILQQGGTQPYVFGVALASNITRRTVSAATSYTVT